MGSGHHHDHGASERRTAIAAVITGTFMIAELIGGFVTGSLALIADAAHMATDAVSLAFAWWGFRMLRRGPSEQRTYGNRRLPVLVAFGNAVAMMLIVAFIAIEAMGRLAAPQPVLAGPMLVVAILGLLANIASFAVLASGDRGNLNIRGALIHVAGDLLGSLGAILAAIIILLTGWTLADPLLSLLVGLLVLRSAIGLARESGHILIEGTPRGLEPGAIAAALEAAVHGVRQVHHVHVWSLDQEQALVTLNACLAEGAAPFAAIAAIKAELKARFDVDHATVEVEPPPVAAADPAAAGKDGG